MAIVYFAVILLCGVLMIIALIFYGTQLIETVKEGFSADKARERQRAIRSVRVPWEILLSR